MTTNAIQDQSGTLRFPLMERRGVALLLAFMSGLMDAWTFGHAQTFATVQSGNVIQSGYRLMQGDRLIFGFALASVVAFGLGSAASGAVMTRMLERGRVYTPVVLALECLILLGMALASRFGLIDAHIVALAVSFVAGVQGDAFHKEGGMLYGNVAVTLVVQMAFNMLCQSFFRKAGPNGEPNLVWSVVFFGVLIAFAAGGGIGFLLDGRVSDHASLGLAALIALVLAISAFREAKSADPDPV